MGEMNVIKSNRLFCQRVYGPRTWVQNWLTTEKGIPYFLVRCPRDFTRTLYHPRSSWLILKLGHCLTTWLKRDLKTVKLSKISCSLYDTTHTPPKRNHTKCGLMRLTIAETFTSLTPAPTLRLGPLGLVT